LFACMQVQQVHDKSDKSRWYMKHDFSAVWAPQEHHVSAVKAQRTQ
jgi:hypothetical protein